VAFAVRSFHEPGRAAWVLGPGCHIVLYNPVIPKPDNTGGDTASDTGMDSSVSTLVSTLVMTLVMMT